MNFREINARVSIVHVAPFLFFTIIVHAISRHKFGKSSVYIDFSKTKVSFFSFKKFFSILFFSFSLFFKYKGTVHVNIQYTIEERYRRSRWVLFFKQLKRARLKISIRSSFISFLFVPFISFFSVLFFSLLRCYALKIGSGFLRF